MTKAKPRKIQKKILGPRGKTMLGILSTNKISYEFIILSKHLNPKTIFVFREKKGTEKYTSLFSCIKSFFKKKSMNYLFGDLYVISKRKFNFKLIFVSLFLEMFREVVKSGFAIIIFVTRQVDFNFFRKIIK